MNTTTIAVEDILTKTADQIIKELKMERCVFDRDDIFNIVIVRDHELAENLKQLNHNKNNTNDIDPITSVDKLKDYTS